MKWVRWSQWTGIGYNHGQMPICGIEKEIQKFEVEARALLKKADADHVIYAVKYYCRDELEEICFYMMPLTDAEFEEKTLELENAYVYALHARRITREC